VLKGVFRILDCTLLTLLLYGLFQFVFYGLPVPKAHHGLVQMRRQAKGAAGSR
jgi:hypothetical protein